MRVERERAHPAREERKHLLRAEAIPCFQAKGKLSALPSLSFFRNALAFADNPCAKKSFFPETALDSAFSGIHNHLVGLRAHSSLPIEA